MWNQIVLPGNRIVNHTSEEKNKQYESSDEDFSDVSTLISEI